jgi:hypothetical protein
MAGAGIERCAGVDGCAPPRPRLLDRMADLPIMFLSAG